MAQQTERRPTNQPPEQLHERPGHESKVQQKPIAEKAAQSGCGKLEGRIALITGGDSGIGRAVAIAFAKEGAKVVISYLKEHEDAAETKRLVEEKGGTCLTIAGDIGSEAFSAQLVRDTLNTFGALD